MVDLFLPEFLLKNSKSFENKKETNTYSVNSHTHESYDVHICHHSAKCDICRVTKQNIKPVDVEFLLSTHQKVKDSGLFNFQGCRIPINTKLNVQYLRSMLTDYKDQRICDYLEFGFPLGCSGDEIISSDIDSKQLWKFKNHKGAEEFPDSMLQYLEKESKHKAILGPFKENPFSSGIKISPLNTVEKSNSFERRIILDLSCPKGASVNDFISKEYYLDEKIDLVYPKVDDFIQLIKQKGQGCLMFKTDLRRAYRQLSYCPSAYNLVAFIWKKHIFCDTALAMGSRSSAYCCQKFSNAIAFSMFKMGIHILNYLDDLASAETEQNAYFAYRTLQTVLEKSGIEEAKNKACPLSTSMVFVGVLFNTVSMTIEITPERLKEISGILKVWLYKEKASLKEVQSLLGKLNFIAACVRPGRIFISRMLQWLKVLHKEDVHLHIIPSYFKKDILWWHTFLPYYNGVSMMLYEEWCFPDTIFSSDACLQGLGGFWDGKYFHAKFPSEFTEKKYSINVLEMFAIIVCLKLWGKFYKGKKIQIFCDNESVCYCLNTGRSKHAILQSCLREVAFLAAIHEFQIKAVHLSSCSNRVADILSRWESKLCHRDQFFELTKEFVLEECVVSDSMFNFENLW